MERSAQQIACVVDVRRAVGGIMLLAHHQIVDLLQVVELVPARELSHVFSRCGRRNTYVGRERGCRVGGVNVPYIPTLRHGNRVAIRTGASSRAVRLRDVQCQRGQARLRACCIDDVQHRLHASGLGSGARWSLSGRVGR